MTTSSSETSTGRQPLRFGMGLRDLAPALGASAALMAWDIYQVRPEISAALELNPYRIPIFLARHGLALAAVLFGLLIWWRLCRRLQEKAKESRITLRRLLFLVSVAAPTALVVFPFVSTTLLKARFESLAIHPQIAWVYSALIALAAGIGALPLRRFAGRGGFWRRALIEAIGLGAAFGLLTLDRRWLPNLYYGIHLIIVVAAAVSLLLAFEALRPARSSKILSFGLSLLLLGVGMHALVDFRPGLADRLRTERKILAVDLHATKRLTPWLYGAAPRAEAPRAATKLSTLRQRQNRARSEARSMIDPGRKANVVIVTVDALRADHVGYQGYERPTTPFLDRLSEKSSVFTNARSAATGSYFSIHALLHNATPQTIAAARGERLESLADRMRTAGWNTCTIFNPLIHSLRPPKWPVPDRSMGFELVSEYGDSAATNVDRLISWIESADERPLFFYTHVMDPHYPYNARDIVDFGKQPIDLYDSEIRAVDSQLERLWQALERHGRTEDLIFIVSADHGESFGEKSIVFHAGPPIESQCHVPLLIHDSLRPEQQRIRTSVSNVSVTPTILDLVQLAPLPAGEFPSLSPLILGVDDGEDWTAVVEVPFLPQFPHQPARRALVRGDWKLIRNLGYDIAQMYDLRFDRREDQDLLAKRPEVADSMLAAEEAWYTDIATLRARRRDSEGDLEFEYLKDALAARDGRAIESLKTLVAQGSPAQRDAAADLLFDTALERSAEDAKKFRFEAAEGDGRNRGLAEALEVASGKKADDEFIALFDSPDESLTGRLARVLARRPDLELPPETLADFDARVSDPSARVELDLAKGARGDASAIPRLFAILSGSHRPMELRLRALKTLASFPDEKMWNRLSAEAWRIGPEATQKLLSAAAQNETEARRDWFRAQMAKPDSKTEVLGCLALPEWSEAFRLEVASRVARLESRPDMRIPALQALVTVPGPEAERALADSMAAFSSAAPLAFRMYLERLIRNGEKPGPGIILADQILKGSMELTLSLPEGSEDRVASAGARRILVAVGAVTDIPGSTAPTAILKDANGRELARLALPRRGDVLAAEIQPGETVSTPLRLELDDAQTERVWKIVGVGIFEVRDRRASLADLIDKTHIPLWKNQWQGSLRTDAAGRWLELMEGHATLFHWGGDREVQEIAMTLSCDEPFELEAWLGAKGLGTKTAAEGSGTLRFSVPVEAWRTGEINPLRIHVRGADQSRPDPPVVRVLRVEFLRRASGN